MTRTTPNRGGAHQHVRQAGTIEEEITIPAEGEDREAKMTAAAQTPACPIPVSSR
jgi:hypothetical protein